MKDKQNAMQIKIQTALMLKLFRVKDLLEYLIFVENQHSKLICRFKGQKENKDVTLR